MESPPETSESCSRIDDSLDYSMMLNEDSDENKLEITRNPFDSNLCNKDNFPILDASVFTDSRRSSEHRSPGGESNGGGGGGSGSGGGGFRWSIDQIAKLQPADLDMFPNQEYSVTYERKEDEERDQQQVDEYFQNVLLPSPWLDSRTAADILKRVTFSPHPPSTRYINAQQHDDSSSTAATDNSDNFTDHKTATTGNVNRRQQQQQQQRDASCQTTLTLPVDFDLIALVGQQYYTHVDETVYHQHQSSSSSKGDSVTASTLRRKLFDQETNNNDDDDDEERHDDSDMVGLRLPTMSSLKLPDTPGYLTSSPTSTNSDSRTPSFSSFDPSNHHNNFNSSNIEAPAIGQNPLFFNMGPSSVESSPIVKQASNVCTPVGGARRHELSFSSVDVSPIGGGSSFEEEKRHEKIEGEGGFSFLPDVTVGLDSTQTGDESVFESSRATRFASPDVSPIGKTTANNSMIAGEGTESMLENSSGTAAGTFARHKQNIKESTARNIHAFSGLELSSIVESASMSKFEDILEDKGPLDITELETEDEEGDRKETKAKVVSDNGKDHNKTKEDIDTNSSMLNTKGLVTRTTQEDAVAASANNINNNASNSMEQLPQEKSPMILTPTTPNRSQLLVGTPLKGILKRRGDTPTPNANKCGKSASGSSVEDTKFNTERNTGRARSRILQSLIVGHGMSNNSVASDGGATIESLGLPKPVIRGFGGNAGNDEDNFTPSPIEAEEKFKWSLSSSLGASVSNEDLVCRRALSAMKRSLKVSSYLEEDIFFDDKENVSYPWNKKNGDARNRVGGGGGRKYQLNSTALAANDGSRSFLSSSSSLKRPFDLSGGGKKLSSTISTDDDNVFCGGEREETAMTQQTDSGVSSMNWMTSIGAGGEQNQHRNEQIQQGNGSNTDRDVAAVKVTEPPLLLLNDQDVPVTPKNEDVKFFSSSHDNKPNQQHRYRQMQCNSKCSTKEEQGQSSDSSVLSMSDQKVPVTPKNDDIVNSFSISPLMSLRELQLRSGGSAGTPCWSKQQMRKGGPGGYRCSPYMYRGASSMAHFLNRSSAAQQQSPLSRSASGGSLSSSFSSSYGKAANRSLVYDRPYSWPSKGSAAAYNRHQQHYQHHKKQLFPSSASACRHRRSSPSPSPHFHTSTMMLSRNKDFVGPRSRVSPVALSKSPYASVSSDAYFFDKERSVFKSLDNIGSSYNDFLPSPLK